MPDQKNIAVLVGSLRKGSYSRQVAQTLASVAPATLDLGIIEIGGLPFYNEDTETDGAPQPWTEFRERILAADAVLFVTPEYNRSVPGVLKNAIDVGSRPYGKNAFDGKPAAVVSTSMGAMGGFGANHHLRQSLVFLNMPTMAQPEAYVGGTGSLFDDAGLMTHEGTKGFLTTVMAAFAQWIDVTG